MSELLLNEKALFFPKIESRLCLNKAGSTKATYHIVLKTDEPLSFSPGDAIALYPENAQEKVEELLSLMGVFGDEMIREALTKHWNIERLPKSLKERFPDSEKEDLLSFLREHPLPFSEVPPLAHLLPRFYSIASSNKLFSHEIHLLVATFTKKVGEQELPGLGSDFLCRRAPLGAPLKAYLHPNEKFSLPKDPKTPLIMIGPGTGVAPFRAFIQERILQGAPMNWLFFGEREHAYDFYYEEEWRVYERSRMLRVTTAFSREPSRKVYVQDRLQEEHQELLNWVAQGAHLYICGDAKRMSRSVLSTLESLLGSKESLRALRHEGRLLLDVY